MLCGFVVLLIDLPISLQRDIYIYLRLSSQHKSEGVQNVFKVEKKLIWEITKS